MDQYANEKIENKKFTKIITKHDESKIHLFGK
jgi:hypothetical protein